MTAEKVAPFFNMSPKSMLNYAAESKSRLYGILLPDSSLFLHPDGVFKEIGRIGKAYTKKLSAPSRNLQRMLKNRQKESLH